MARRISELNGDAPPPSTLAAQIVQKQTRPAPQQNGSDVQLQDLLHEMLHNPNAVQETSVSVNVKLIHVVAEAGLAPLGQNDPFGPSEHLLQEAKDSIAVIEKTIKRQPELLLTPTSPDGPQLALLLLCRLASVCGRPKCEDLPVAQLLDTAIRTLNASVDLWRDAATLQQLVQDTINECLLALETAGSSSSLFSCKVPSPKMLVAMWPESQNEVALPYGCRTTVETRAHAFMLAMHLFNLPTLEPAWRSNVHLRLQGLLLEVRPTLEKAKQWQEALRSNLAMPNNSLVLQGVLGDLEHVKLTVDTQQQLATSLVRALRSDDSYAHSALLAALQVATASKSFDSLHEDLRIAIATWLVRYLPEHQLPEHIAQLRDAIQQGGLMTDSDFQDTFKHLGISGGPPQPCTHRRKRRRISADAIKVEPPTAANELLRLLETEAEDLALLPRTASTAYVGLSESDQCRVWQLLARMATSELPIAARTVSDLLQLPKLRDNKRAR
ncbi:serine/threonine-protein kinase M1, partial [Teratosphaeriaceae sp. CCFEE 6253]